MIRRIGGPLGLMGRILAILLITVVIEFGVSTLLYERAGRFSLHEDEAHRLAEHLQVARQLVAGRPWKERPMLAGLVSNERYTVRWGPIAPQERSMAPQLANMTRQIITWEPELAESGLRLQLAAGATTPAIGGSLRLPDGSWMEFKARESLQTWDIASHRILLALGPALALFAIGGLLIRKSLQPLRLLARATDRIGYGEPAHVEEAGTFEVRQLIRAYNAMQDRIHQLVEDRTQALAAVGHDLRTPIARLQLRAEGIEQDPLRRDVRGDLDEIEAMLSSLMAFLGGESDPEPPVRADLAVMAATIVQDFEDRGLPATYRGPAHLELPIRASAIRRSLVNLVENGFHYGGAARVTLETGPGGVVLAVEDDGPGIAADKFADVVQPFVRLDSARARNTQGLGLGLAIVAQAARRSGGALLLSNLPTGGLRAEIRLPAM